MCVCVCKNALFLKEKCKIKFLNLFCNRLITLLKNINLNLDQTSVTLLLFPQNEKHFTLIQCKEQ